MPGELDDSHAAEFGDWDRRQRAEFRSAAEEFEEAIEDARDRSRDLGDVALEAMHRGDTVVANVGSRTFTGHVTHVGHDVITVTDQAGNHVDIALPSMTYYAVTEETNEGGQPLESTFPAHFRECFFDVEVNGAEVEVGGTNLAPTTGSVALVGSDHIVMCAKGRHDWVLPLAAVGYLIRR
jgi:hypothetical protein